MMAPAKSTRSISQGAFESLVKENMEDLGMEPVEALEDAIQSLTIQGVDFSGIIKTIPGFTCSQDNMVIQSLNRLRSVASDLAVLNLKHNNEQSPKKSREKEVNMTNLALDFDEIFELLDKLCTLCSDKSSYNASIATKNGGVEVVSSICAALPYRFEQHLVPALRILACLLHDIQSTEAFRNIGGPKIIVDILNSGIQSRSILDGVFTVIAAAAAGNEILKESFMELNIDDSFLQIIIVKAKPEIPSLYEALRVLLTPDDNSVLASQVYGYARRFAKIGMTEALVEAIRDGPAHPCFIAANTALKALAVNDDICKSISNCGGVVVILHCIDESIRLCNMAAAKICCSVLSKLAGSDANKCAIVKQGGLGILIILTSTFSDDPSVLQEVMSIICALSLRSPENAAKAVEAGAGNLAVQAMQKFPAAAQMQRQACLMVRNLVVRNRENRTILLNNGIERIIRGAKQKHVCCKDAAAAALRDLGLNNYS